MRGIILLLLAGLITMAWTGCDTCYEQQIGNCREDEVGLESYTLHMSVHPHLDAYWIFNFDSYYDPQTTQSEVRNYFESNRFSSVKNIFDTITNVLWDSKNLRENVSNKTQKAHRSFFNSEMGFFKHWYLQQTQQTKKKVKSLLSTKYWQIVGGGYVQHDEGCAYYDDIIQNFELGLRFLQKEFNYHPKVAISADSFGHSQSTLAILAHLGIQGFLVERSDEHILLKNKTEFIWKAKSANGRVYGALPTHIRWAIHGFQDQFIPGDNIYEDLCITKKQYFGNIKDENSFLKRILKSPHILRYFGHDFQKFDDHSYNVIQSIMKKFTLQKCEKLIGVYGNPSQYFITLMDQVFGNKIKPLASRSQDLFPIWDYDSGLYWTGYFTTDAYHKKNYRDLGRLLRGVRKFFLPLFVAQPGILKYKKYYQLLEETAEQVSFLQHHDGISGTSKYDVMDQLEQRNNVLYQQLAEEVLGEVYAIEFPLGTDAQYFRCFLGEDCVIPKGGFGDIYLKVLNSDGSSKREPIILNLPANEFYLPNCEYEINCFCIQFNCPCKLYLFKQLATYSTIRLRKVQKQQLRINRLTPFKPDDKYSFNSSHFQITHEKSLYSIGYKKVQSRPTNRKYEHLSRYGSQYQRDFSIRPGKYALGNDPSTVRDLSSIKQVFTLKSNSFTFFVILWKRYGMKTLISISNSKPNQWKVQTLSSTQGYNLQDLYLQISSPIVNNNKFTTDSNGWLSIQRQLFKHEDYQAFFSPQKYDDINGNTYPATSFVYIKDGNDKLSVNLDRPQGVIALRSGTIWINFDRVTQDDGKWVYESAYRSEYQRYTHIVTVKNKDYNERVIQRLYDQPLFIQGNLLSPNKRVEQTDINFNIRNQWDSKTNINNIKFNFRPYNDSTIIVRIHNLHDEEEITVGLFADKYSPLLTTFYGRTTTFKEIQEMALGGNMKYSQFLGEKWNWKRVVDLQNQNQIFNKKFRQNITLSPLEIRTFLIKQVQFDGGCITPQQLKYDQQQIIYDMDLEKPQPKRELFTIKLEQQIMKFMKNGDHCNGASPILEQSNLAIMRKPLNLSTPTNFIPHLIEKPVQVKAPQYPQVAVPAYLTGDTATHDILTDITRIDQAINIINQKVDKLKMLSVQEKDILFKNKLAVFEKAKKQQRV